MIPTISIKGTSFVSPAQLRATSTTVNPYLFLVRINYINTHKFYKGWTGFKSLHTISKTITTLFLLLLLSTLPPCSHANADLLEDLREALEVRISGQGGIIQSEVDVKIQIAKNLRKVARGKMDAATFYKDLARMRLDMPPRYGAAAFIRSWPNTHMLPNQNQIVIVPQEIITV